MIRTATGTARVRRTARACLAAVALGIAVTGCGGDDKSDTPTTTTVVAAEVVDSESPDLVKNRPLNNCVSVFSGERPTRPQTREELIAQRERMLAAMPAECRPGRR